MNPFANRLQNEQQQQWVFPVTAMCLVLGLMISIAWVNEKNRTDRLARLDPDQRTRVTQASIDLDVFQKTSTEVEKLRDENTRLQNALANQSGQSKVLNDSLQETKVFAGLTPAEGPGVQITLRDSSKGAQNYGGTMAVTADSVIHDTDVLHVVNELFACGAEAISVNDHRVVSGTSFRCVGPTIVVDGVRIAPPIVVRAIGDPATLAGGMNLPGGVLSQIRESDPGMIEIHTMKLVLLPAYAGNTSRKYLSVPKK